MSKDSKKPAGKRRGRPAAKKEPATVAPGTTGSPMGSGEAPETDIKIESSSLSGQDLILSGDMPGEIPPSNVTADIKVEFEANDDEPHMEIEKAGPDPFIADVNMKIVDKSKSTFNLVDGVVVMPFPVERASRIHDLATELGDVESKYYVSMPISEFKDLLTTSKNNAAEIISIIDKVNE